MFSDIPEPDLCVDKRKREDFACKHCGECDAWNSPSDSRCLKKFLRKLKEDPHYKYNIDYFNGANKVEGIWEFSFLKYGNPGPSGGQGGLGGCGGPPGPGGSLLLCRPKVPEDPHEHQLGEIIQLFK